MSLRRRRIAGATAAFLLAIVSAVPGAGAAVTDPDAPILDGALSLEDAVKLALQNNRPLQIAVEERKVAEGRRVESRAEALPHVELYGAYERQSEEVAFTFPDPVNPGASQRVQLGYLNNYRADLTVTQTLYEGGRVQAALRASKLYQSYADEQVRLAVQAAIYDTVRTYYDILLAQRELDVAQSAKRLAESLLKDVETKKKFGVASDFEVLRSRVEVSNASAQVVVFQNRLSTGLSELFKILGVSQESRVTLPVELTYVPTTTDEAAAVAEALAVRPDVLSADLATRLQAEALAAAKSPWFPKIGAFWTCTAARPDPVVGTVDDWGNTWRAGVTVTWSVFDGGAALGRVQQERARLRQQEIGVVEIGEQTKLDVRKAVLAIRDAAEAVEVQLQTLDQATEGLRLAEVGYREGTLSQVSVLEARAALTQSQLFYFRSLYAHATARLDLERAKGTLGAAVR